MPQKESSIYTKLNLSRREIRLCSLEPGKRDVLIQCTFYTVALDDNPDYEALSYAWGDPASLAAININGRPMLITTNLHSALQHLRDTDEPRIIWIDAICINQSDTDERSQQVGIMGDIYSQAREVQIYLGEVEGILPGISTQDLTLIKDNDLALLEGFTGRRGSFPKPSPLRTMPSDGERAEVFDAFTILQILAADKHFYEMPLWYVNADYKIEMSHLWYNSLRLLSVMLSRPWWKRLWVVQEAVLASAATINYGTSRIPLSLVLDAASNYKKHRNTCCKQWNNLWHGSSENDLYESTKSITELASMKSDFDDSVMDLQSYLIYSRRREASVPLDHVYALLGLLKDDLDFRANFARNYHLTAAKLYSRVTLELIRRRHSLLDLVKALGVGTYNPLDLPSWTCDWSRDTGLWVTPYFLDASSGEIHESVSNANENVLIVQGLEIDSISRAGDIIQSSVNIWHYLNDSFEQIHTNVEMAIRRSRIFTTNQGFLGTGAYALRQGDKVFVLRGSHVPVLLRRFDGTMPEKPQSQDTDDRYSLVGVCYVHGIMDGEAANSDVEWKNLHLH